MVLVGVSSTEHALCLIEGLELQKGHVAVYSNDSAEVQHVLRELEPATLSVNHVALEKSLLELRSASARQQLCATPPPQPQPPRARPSQQRIQRSAMAPGAVPDQQHGLPRRGPQHLTGSHGHCCFIVVVTSIRPFERFHPPTTARREKGPRQPPGQDQTPCQPFATGSGSARSACVFPARPLALLGKRSLLHPCRSQLWRLQALTLGLDELRRRICMKIFKSFGGVNPLYSICFKPREEWPLVKHDHAWCACMREKCVVGVEQWQLLRQGKSLYGTEPLSGQTKLFTRDLLHARIRHGQRQSALHRGLGLRSSC